MLLVQRRRRWVQRLALACTVLALAVTTVSAFIRLSQAGPGCRPWPQCQDRALRDTQAGPPAAATGGAAVVAARMAHRVLAGAVLLLVLAMLVGCFGAAPLLMREGTLVLLALAAVTALALVGRATAGSRLPAVAIANLVGGALTVAICWRLAAARRPPAPARAPGWLAVAVLVVQLALGALSSASLAAGSCGSLRECVDTARAAGWPAAALDPRQVPSLPSRLPDARAAGAMAMVQLAHRAGALAAALAVSALGVAAWRGARRCETALLAGLLAAQLLAGAALAGAGAPLALALAHNAIGIVLLAVALSAA